MPPTSPDPNPTPDAPDQQQPALPQQPGAPSGPVSFVPHTPSGAVSSNDTVRIRTSRYGELDAHELVHLLDSIEDERARGRFRESIYISIFIWLIIAWVVFYGPKYLWHAPQLRLAATHQQKLLTLNAPHILNTPGAPTVRPRPTPPPTVDEKTLSRLREMDRPTPAPAPAPSPAPHPVPEATTPAPVTPRPATPSPQPVPTRTPPAAIPEAPKPQQTVSGNPNPNPFTTPRKPDYTHTIPRETPPAPTIPLRGGGALGSSSQILSDTQGVDFTAWQRRFVRETTNVWEPMLPEEVNPPLNKRGTTVLDITILPDGSIGDMKLAGSTHDEALNRAAWGSITSQGKLAPLPKDFHGPNIVIRVFFVVGDEE